MVIVACLGGCGSTATPTPLPAGTSPPARITNGEHAATCQWPSTVALVSWDGSPYCSGTLIHPRFVLTAAHCITVGGAPQSIGFGEDGFEPVRSIGVADCTIHPEFESGVDVDLAVCELDEAVTDVQPVPVLMGCEQDVIGPGTEVVIAGFGNTQTQFLGDYYWSGEGIGPKRFVAQTVYRVREEAEEIDLLGIDTMSGGCHGDSGGPAFVKLADGTWRVVAVAQSLWNVPGYPWGSGGVDDTGVDPTTGVAFIDPTTGGSFIDPTSGVAFIDPTATSEPVDVCGYGTTYTLVTPRMDWVEGIVGEDVTPCFATDGSWDPNDACTPFPMQLDQSIGTWAEGCAGELGGEPQCGELGGSSGSESGSGTAGSSTGGSSSSGPGPDPETDGGPSSTSTDGTSSPTTTTTTTPIPGTSGSESSDSDDPGAAGDDKGCGCRHDGGRPSWAAFAVLALVVGRRRARSRRDGGAPAVGYHVGVDARVRRRHPTAA